MANQPVSQMWDSSHQPGSPPESGAAASPVPPVAAPVTSPVIDLSAGSAIALRRVPARDDAKTSPAELAPKPGELALKKEQPGPKEKAFNQVAASQTVEADASVSSSTTAYAPTDKDEFRASSAEIANLSGFAAARPAATWQITDGGNLQRSFDGGKSWESVTLNQPGRLRVVTATGFQVWAGGNRGVLFHSQDAGGHFATVKVHRKHATLSGDIVALAFPDAQHGRIETADHEVWTTTDAGKTWRRP